MSRAFLFFTFCLYTIFIDRILVNDIIIPTGGILNDNLYFYMNIIRPFIYLLHNPVHK
jgi:hypothetical protein